MISDLPRRTHTGTKRLCGARGAREALLLLNVAAPYEEAEGPCCLRACLRACLLAAGMEPSDVPVVAQAMKEVLVADGRV
jgi:hypothetical protein